MMELHKRIRSCGYGKHVGTIRLQLDRGEELVLQVDRLGLDQLEEAIAAAKRDEQYDSSTKGTADERSGVSV